MKKFLLNLFVFGMLLGLILLFLSSLGLPTSYVQYKTAETPYEKVAWNLELISKHPEQIKGKAIFLGPSVTQAGVCDSTLCALGLDCINMGTNGPGNEIELYFLEKIMALGPKKIYLHAFINRHRGLHSMTPLLYDPISLLTAGQGVNIDFAQFILKRTGFVLDLGSRTAFRLKMTYDHRRRYGVRYEPKMPAAEYNSYTRPQMQNYLDNLVLDKNGFKKRSEREIKGTFISLICARRKVLDQIGNLDFFYNKTSQENFNEKAIALVVKNKVVASKVYLPIMAEAKTGENFSGYLQAPGNLPLEVLRDFEFLNNPNYWADFNHLSREGAIVFTSELLEEGTVNKKPEKDQLSCSGVRRKQN